MRISSILYTLYVFAFVLFLIAKDAVLRIPQLIVIWSVSVVEVSLEKGFKKKEIMKSFKVSWEARHVLRSTDKSGKTRVTGKWRSSLSPKI